MDQGGTAEEKGCSDGNGPGRLEPIIPEPHMVTIRHLAGHVERLLDVVSEIGRAVVVLCMTGKSAVKAKIALDEGDESGCKDLCCEEECWG